MVPQPPVPSVTPASHLALMVLVSLHEIGVWQGMAGLWDVEGAFSGTQSPDFPTPAFPAQGPCTQDQDCCRLLSPRFPAPQEACRLSEISPTHNCP